MISVTDFYSVMSAMVPLYVAMILAYGSVRWWKILTPDQCSGINRFVAIFAVPLLSFQIIAHNNPYEMSVKFILADALQKLTVLLVLGLWTRYSSKGSLEWMITLFMLATLPNTLVMGIPLLNAMYGPGPGNIVVQAVVLQCIVWYTFLLFMFEYRSARLLISERFPKPAAPAASVVSVKVDPDVVSVDCKEALNTQASFGDDGKIYVQVRKSPTSSLLQGMYSASSITRTCTPEFPSSTFSSRASTPGGSDLTNAEIYSVHSSNILTPGNNNNNSFLNRSSDQSDFYLMMSGSRNTSPFRLQDIESLDGEVNVVSGPASFNDVQYRLKSGRHPPGTPNLEEHFRHLVCTRNFSQTAIQITKNEDIARSNLDYYAKELQMFVWSATTSPKSPASVEDPKLRLWSKEEKLPMSHEKVLQISSEPTLIKSGAIPPSKTSSCLTKLNPFASSTHEKQPDVPSATIMTKLILDMVWKKLVRNPNTYSSVLGITWALISFRWNVRLPKIIDGSITILSDAGLGMAMFSLGLFMALQPKLLACGTSMTLIGMVIRFLTSPAVMSATSIATGLGNLDLRASIIQAALPQGIVPFVFAKEYNVHPDVLSTAVIFGMLVSLPISLLYYVLLGL